MANKFIYSMENVKRRLARLGSFEEVVYASSLYVKNELVNLWNKGVGGDGNKMKKLSPSYAKEKAATGRRAIPDINRTGSLQASLRVKNVGNTLSVSISPSGVDAHGVSNLEKLRSIQEVRDNVISVSKNRHIVKKVLNMCYTYLSKVKSMVSGVSVK